MDSAITLPARHRRTDYGPHAIRRLPARIEALGWKRVLLVSGKASFERSGAAALLPDLRARVALEHWNDFATNTDYRDVEKGLQLLRAFRPDGIVAVGGGSAMDIAKALCAFETVSGNDALQEAIRRGVPAAPRRLGLYLAPTTSGSGSEATHFAVVYIGEDKYSIAAPSLRPDALTLDPMLASSGSPYQRATSGIDAVCQAIESLWATGGTDESRRLARRALFLLVPHIAGFVKSPDERSARAMCIGSHLAGRAIDISKTTAAHALAYAITKRFGPSHGHAVALTLGRFIEAHAGAGGDALQSKVDVDGHAGAMAFILGVLGASDGKAARQRFEDLLGEIGLESQLQQVGVTSVEARDGLVASVNVERLQNNPVKFSRDDLLGIIT